MKKPDEQKVDWDEVSQIENAKPEQDAEDAREPTINRPQFGERIGDDDLVVMDEEEIAAELESQADGEDQELPDRPAM